MLHKTIVSAKYKKVAVPLIAPGIQGLFPDAKTVTLDDGQNYLLLPHEETEVFLLRKMGFEVAAPIMSHYEWPAPLGKPPFRVQMLTSSMLTMAERAFVLNGMGTGKTKCVLWAWDYLRRQKRIGKLLVVAPLSTLNFVWRREAFETLPDIKVNIVHGTKAQRIAALNDADASIFVINHDGIKVVEKELLAHPEIDAVAIDELAAYRNKSERTLAMKRIAHKMKWAWGLTGSPMPHSPTDVYFQTNIITPDNVPARWTHFRDQVLTKVNNFKWVPKEGAIEHAYSVMQPAVRYTIDDVQELPEVIERFIDVPLGAKQAKIYKDIVQHCQSIVGSGQITAANAGAALNKLLQISLGWVYDRDHNVVPLDNQHRIDALMDCIESTDRKVLVFVPFIHALAGVGEALKKEKYEYVTVSGDTPQKERDRAFNLFQNTSKFKVLLAHPQCLAHGITLTAADTVVWFAPVTSLEIYDQANHRIRRVGQKHKQQILHLQSTAVERKIYKLLQTNQATQANFLKMFEDTNEEW